jgi:hypothetical protein
MMIKLTSILNELRKDTWQQLDKRQVEPYKDELLDLIQQAYKEIGGHPNFKTDSDITSGNGGDVYDIIDLDSDHDIDAVNVSKEKPSGHKLVAMGHDGTSDAKRAAINQQASQLKTRGWYMEVSGKIKDILLAKGVKPVTDEKLVRKALSGKDIVWHGDGTYDRKIGGETHTKMMVGKPL